MDMETKKILDALCKNLVRYKIEEILDKKVKDLVKSEIKRGLIK